MIAFAGIACHPGPCQSHPARLAMPAWRQIGGRGRGPCAAAFRRRQIKRSAARNSAAPSGFTKTRTVHKKSVNRTVQGMSVFGKPTGRMGTGLNACAVNRTARLYLTIQHTHITNRGGQIRPPTIPCFSEHQSPHRVLKRPLARLGCKSPADSVNLWYNQFCGAS